MWVGSGGVRAEGAVRFGGFSVGEILQVRGARWCMRHKGRGEEEEYDNAQDIQVEGCDRGLGQVDGQVQVKLPTIHPCPHPGEGYLCAQRWE